MKTKIATHVMFLAFLGLSVFAAGCKTPGMTLRSTGPAGPVIDLKPLARDGFDEALFEGKPSTTFELPGPPPPNTAYGPPETRIPNTAAYPKPKLPPSANEAKRILTQVYKMPIRGYLSTKNVKNAYYSASFFRPSQTRNVVWTFYNRGGMGYSGLYTWGGRIATIKIYAAGFHTCLHELCHHISLYYKNRKSKQICNKVRSYGQRRRDCVPSSYSRTNNAEFMAEYFSFFAMKWFKFGQASSFRSFNPPKNVKAFSRTLYVKNWGNSGR